MPYRFFAQVSSRITWSTLRWRTYLPFFLRAGAQKSCWQNERVRASRVPLGQAYGRGCGCGLPKLPYRKREANQVLINPFCGPRMTWPSLARKRVLGNRFGGYTFGHGVQNKRKGTSPSPTTTKSTSGRCSTRSGTADMCTRQKRFLVPGRAVWLRGPLLTTIGRLR